eukprot:SAG31_NODE_258_length_18937_cov_61.688555_27_plen_151_part_00
MPASLNNFTRMQFALPYVVILPPMFLPSILRSTGMASESFFWLRDFSRQRPLGRPIVRRGYRDGRATMPSRSPAEIARVAGGARLTRYRPHCWSTSRKDANARNSCGCAEFPNRCEIGKIARSKPPTFPRRPGPTRGSRGCAAGAVLYRL